MGSTVIKAIITVGVLFLAVVMAYGLVVTSPAPDQMEPEAIATSIRVKEVQPETVRLKVRSQGTVHPLTESELIPEVTGKVAWVSPNLSAGGFFDDGEVLLRIDDRDYRSALERAQAAHARAEAEEEHARFELERREKLVQDRLASQADLEGALRSHRIAEAALKEANVTLQQAERDLERTSIRAPFRGLVRTKKVDLGQFVSRGSSIAQIYASDYVEVRLPIADSQLAFLDLPLGSRGELPAERQATVILSTDYGGEHYEWIGSLIRTEAAIDSKTRMVYAVARVENDRDPESPPMPVGLFVNAEIFGREVANVFVLPRAAIRNQNQVLVVDAENRLRYRNVDVLRYDGDQVFIQGGLAGGELVNLTPIQTVIDGMRVKPAARG